MCSGAGSAVGYSRRRAGWEVWARRCEACMPPMQSPTIDCPLVQTLQLWHRALGAADGAHTLQRYDASTGGSGCGAKGAAPPHPPKLPAAAV